MSHCEIGLGCQTSGALTTEGSDPAANSADIDAKEVGDFLVGVALEDALDGEPAAILQDLG